MSARLPHLVEQGDCWHTWETPDEAGETHVWPNEPGHVEAVDCPCRPRHAPGEPRVVVHERLPQVVH